MKIRLCVLQYGLIRCLRLLCCYIIRRQALTGDRAMLETIAILLLIMWALGMVSSYSLGGLIHLLLVLAIVVVVIRVIQGRRI
jgi:hypothetical protein